MERSDGTLRAIGGVPSLGTAACPTCPAVEGEQPYLGTRIHPPTDLAIGPDGRDYVRVAGRVYEITRPGPLSTSAGGHVVPSEDGTELYVFDDDGRHLRTVQARTGALLYQFFYGQNGELVSVTDPDGH